MEAVRSTWQQLLAGKRARSKGSLSALQRELWLDFRIAGIGRDQAMEADDADEVRKWLHVRNQIAGTFAKVAMEGDIEERLAQLEAAAATNGHRVYD